MKTKIGKTKNVQSLAVTLAITFSALIIVVLLIASSLQMYFNFQAQQKNLIAHQQLIAQDAANTVEGFIREKFRILEVVASRGNLVIIPQEEQKLVLEKLLGLEPAFRQLALLNAQEEEMLRVSRLSKLLSVQLMKYNRSELFPKVSQKETYISPVYIDKVTNEPIVIMAVPATDVFGDFKGTLIAEANLKFMWALMDQIEIGRNGQAYVVNMQGYLIAFRDISRVLKRENLGYLKEVNEFIESSVSLHESRAEISKGILNTYVLATHVHLNTPRWAVVVELPVMEAYETVMITLILSGLVMLLSIMSAIALGIFLSRRMTKPIIELRDATEKIGKGQLTSKIDIKSKNEIGDLATSFNKMVEDLNNTTVSRDALAKEVTERRKAEETLRESEQKMKAILRASPIGIGLVINRQLDWANETMYRMVGYEEGSLLGQSAAIFYPNDNDYKRVGRELYAGITESRTSHVETQWIRKDGTMFDCILRACSLDPTDPSSGQIVTIDDITARKQAEEKIKESLKEKELLLQEIHHRVKNNMQVISSLLKLQAATIKEETLRSAFRDTEHRVRAMSLVHEKLYQSKDFTHIPFRDYLTSLIRYLYQSYTPQAGEIELVTEIDELPLTITHAIPCGLIVNELVSNSFTHAFPDKRKGTITISLRSPAPHTYELTVSDDGIGLPDEIDPTTTTSLGLHLVSILVEDQLKGTIELERTRGTTVHIVFGIPQ